MSNIGFFVDTAGDVDLKRPGDHVGEGGETEVFAPDHGNDEGEDDEDDDDSQCTFCLEEGHIVDECDKLRELRMECRQNNCDEHDAIFAAQQRFIAADVNKRSQHTPEPPAAATSSGGASGRPPLPPQDSIFGQSQAAVPAVWEKATHSAPAQTSKRQPLPPQESVFRENQAAPPPSAPTGLPASHPLSHQWSPPQHERQTGSASQQQPTGAQNSYATPQNPFATRQNPFAGAPNPWSKPSAPTQPISTFPSSSTNTQNQSPFASMTPQQQTNSNAASTLGRAQWSNQQQPFNHHVSPQQTVQAPQPVPQQAPQTVQVAATAHQPDAGFEAFCARHFETLGYSHCAICLCPRPTGTNKEGNVDYPPAATSNEQILDINDDHKSILRAHMHTSHLCTMYTTHGIPPEHESEFWAYACPYFRGYIPVCMACGIVGCVLQSSGDALMFPVQACELPIEGLSVEIRCRCPGQDRGARKRWVTAEFIERNSQHLYGAQMQMQMQPVQMQTWQAQNADAETEEVL